jgi:hypothetical protein
MSGEWRRKDRDEKSKSNLARPEAKIFYAMVKEARGNKRALAGVSVAQDELGLPTSWLRERVAGRIRVKPVDLEVLQRLINIAKSRVYHSGITVEEATARRRENAKPSAELAEYRRAVRRMCRECVGCDGRDKDEDLECPDGSCPLRPISPLKLSAKPIVVGETWE